MDNPDGVIIEEVATGGIGLNSSPGVNDSVAIGHGSCAREPGDICISAGGPPLEIYLAPKKGMITFGGIDLRQLIENAHASMALANLADQIAGDDPPAEIYLSKSKGTITIDGVNIRDLAQKIERLRPLFRLADYARNEAVRKIQRCWRAHLARRQYAARIIQYYWYEYLYGVGRGKYFTLGAQHYLKVQKSLSDQS